LSDIVRGILLEQLAVFLYALLPILSPDVILAADAISLALGHAIDVFHGQLGVLLRVL